MKLGRTDTDPPQGDDERTRYETSGPFFEPCSRFMKPVNFLVLGVSLRVAAPTIRCFREQREKFAALLLEEGELGFQVRSVSCGVKIRATQFRVLRVRVSL